MGYMLEGGKIVCDDGAYPIESVEVSYGCDMHDVSGVLRMTDLKIESDAPFEVKDDVERKCFNKLCEEEFVEEGGCWSEKAKKSIKKCLGVDDDVIII